MTGERRRLRVLSIDGGGMRGLYTAAYLESLAKHYADTRKVAGLDIGKGFNLIVGTSTGAIIALRTGGRHLAQTHDGALSQSRIPDFST